MCGKLELIIGPMFSGKSTELIRRIRLLQIIDKKILVIKPVIDSRYNIDKITSHNYESIDCKVLEKQSLKEPQMNTIYLIIKCMKKNFMVKIKISETVFFLCVNISVHPWF